MRRITDIIVLGTIILFVWFALSSISQIFTGKRDKDNTIIHSEPIKESCVGFNEDGKMIIKKCDEVFKDD